MAYALKELREGFSIDDGIDRKVVVRRYKISGLPVSVGNDPNRIFDASFPTIGQPDVVYPNAICISRRVVAIITPNGTDENGNTGAIALALAIFRSNNPFSGGPRPISQFYTRDDPEFEVPAYELIVDGIGGNTFYLYSPIKAIRPTGIRVETRFIASFSISSIQSAILDHVGGLFDVDNNGKYAIFLGGNASTSNTGYTVVQYRFAVDAAIKSVPIGPLTDVEIPALPPLHEYVVRISGGIPVVSVRLPDDIHFIYNNTVLPGL